MSIDGLSLKEDNENHDEGIEEEEMVQKHYSKHSILLETHQVKSLVEYAKNKLLVHIYDIDYMIIEHWNKVRIIEGISKSNVDKNWLQPLPGFNEETFPFLISSGLEHLNLINIKEEYH